MIDGVVSHAKSVVIVCLSFVYLYSLLIVLDCLVHIQANVQISEHVQDGRLFQARFL